MPNIDGTVVLGIAALIPTYVADDVALFAEQTPPRRHLQSWREASAITHFSRELGTCESRLWDSSCR